MPLPQRKNIYLRLFGSRYDAVDIEAYVEYLENQRDCSSECSDEWYNWADDDDYSAIHIDGESDDEPDEPVIGPIRKGPGKFFNSQVKTPYSKFHTKNTKMGYRLPQRMYCVNGASLRTERRPTGESFCNNDSLVCKKTFSNHIRGKSGSRKQITEFFYYI